MTRTGRSTNQPESRKLIRGSKALERGLNRKGTSDQKMAPADAGRAAILDPTICPRCAAVYTRKKWHRAGELDAKGAAKALCPACLQVAATEYFGRVILRSPGADEAEIRRRIENVARRAGHTQPARKLVAVERRGVDLDVFTTSQKLAHRIAREIEKAFGGDVHYDWADRDGSLLAIWSGPKPAPE